MKPPLEKCPKCGGAIFKDEDEETCVNCGFTKYLSPLPHVPKNKVYG
jgi:hypothetical protein